MLAQTPDALSPIVAGLLQNGTAGLLMAALLYLFWTRETKSIPDLVSKFDLSLQAIATKFDASLRSLTCDFLSASAEKRKDYIAAEIQRDNDLKDVIGRLEKAINSNTEAICTLREQVIGCPNRVQQVSVDRVKLPRSEDSGKIPRT